MVSGFFGGQTAAYDSDLSLIAEGYPDTDRHISNHVAKLGEMTTFGWYEAGTELTFKLFVHDTGDTFYSNTAMNPDGMEHARAFQFALPNGSLSVFTPVIFMGFEDLLGGGDMDFNDNMAMFSNFQMCGLLLIAILVSIDRIGNSLTVRIFLPEQINSGIVVACSYSAQNAQQQAFVREGFIHNIL